MNNYYLHGPCCGKVTDNEDPDGFGRVRVLVEILEESFETSWIPVLSLYASAECGAFFLPEVDDQVIVAFTGDNADSGVVLGGFWSDNQKPPETGENTASDLNQDGKNNLRFIKSRSGHQIIFDDKDGEEKIQILAKGGKTRYEFLAKDKKLNIETDQDFRISAGKKLSIEADEAQIKIDKGFKLEADSIKMESKSQNVEVKANQSIKIEGTSVKLN